MVEIAAAALLLSLLQQSQVVFPELTVRRLVLASASVSPFVFTWPQSRAQLQAIAQSSLSDAVSFAAGKRPLPHFIGPRAAESRAARKRYKCCNPADFHIYKSICNACFRNYKMHSERRLQTTRTLPHDATLHRKQ